VPLSADVYDDGDTASLGVMSRDGDSDWYL